MRSILRYTRWPLTLLLLGGVGFVGWYAIARGKNSAHTEAVQKPQEKAPLAITVEVERPQPGGLIRTCVQPGTVEPIKSTDVYAKASGFLIEQKVESPGLSSIAGVWSSAGGGKPEVDIGTRVNAGDILARISVPEYEKSVERDEARLRHADAKVKQMEAHVRSAQAEGRAADAMVGLSRVMVKVKAAYRSYRQKQLERIKGLVAERALDAKLLDEQEDFYLSAVEGENGAIEQVNTSLEKAAAAKAKIDQAMADVDEAKAEVGVAEAVLANSRVLLEYTIIRSPFTGVVTKRNFFPGNDGRPGDFIKSADQGGIVPLLAVERTDVMRIVVQVPDRDVPYLSTTSTTVVEIDALPDAVYDKRGKEKLTVTRKSDAEDPATRTMRTEIEVPNEDGRLRHGMYGRVTITLGTGTPNALHIPSSALVGKPEGGRGSVRVVRDGKVKVLPVRYATDNGLEIEIVSGLSVTDQVIVRSSAPIDEGSPVIIAEAKSSGH